MSAATAPAANQMLTRLTVSASTTTNAMSSISQTREEIVNAIMCLPAFLPRPCNAAVVAAAPRTVYGRTLRPGVRSTFAAEAKPGFWLCRLGFCLLLLYHIRQRIDKAQKKPVSPGFGLGGRFFQSYCPNQTRGTPGEAGPRRPKTGLPGAFIPIYIGRGGPAGMRNAFNGSRAGAPARRSNRRLAAVHGVVYNIL